MDLWWTLCYTCLGPLSILITTRKLQCWNNLKKLTHITLIAFDPMLMWRQPFRFLYTILWLVFSKGKVGARDAVLTVAESINRVVFLPLQESYSDWSNGPFHAMHYRMIGFSQSSFYCGNFFCKLYLVACKPSITMNLVTNRTTGKRCCQSRPYGGCGIEYWEWQFSLHSTTYKTHAPFSFLKVPNRASYLLYQDIHIKWKTNKNNQKVMYELSNKWKFRNSMMEKKITFFF